MKLIREELEYRRQNRQNARKTGWFSLLIKALLLIMLFTGGREFAKRQGFDLKSWLYQTSTTEGR